MIPKQVEHALKRFLGKDRILTAKEDRVTYGYDATAHECLPDLVVFPANVQEVSRVMKVADAHQVPVVPRGAGSGLTGGAIPLAGGIVMVMSAFNHVLNIDTENFQAVVEPGVVTAKLQSMVEARGLFYPPDPASMTFCSIGGNIAENAGGMRAVKYGVTKEFVMGLEVVLPNGDIIHTGSKCIKDVVGYDLTRLFVGSEGTLGIITQAILKLLPKPEDTQTMTATFATMDGAARAVPAIFQAGIIPTTLEFMDRLCIRAVESALHLGLPVEAAALLLIEVDGKPSVIADDMARIRNVCVASEALGIEIARDQESRERLWRSRRAVHAALGKLRPHWEEEDVSVPRARIPELIAALEAIGRRFDVLIASFGHAGDGNVHVGVAARDERLPLETLFKAKNQVLEATVALEGRIAAEHGIGLLKRDKIGWNIDDTTLALMQSIKRLVDPKGILNPGKIFPSTVSCRQTL